MVAAVLVSAAFSVVIRTGMVVGRMRQLESDRSFNNLLTETTEKWAKSLRNLLFPDEASRRTMGQVGRDSVERSNFLKIRALRFLFILREAAL